MYRSLDEKNYQAIDNMQYGTENEPHAMATLVNRILPVVPELQGLTYIEEGWY